MGVEQGTEVKSACQRYEPAEGHVVSKWDSESNGSIYERSGMGTCAYEVMCGGGMGKQKHPKMVWLQEDEE